MSLDLKGPFLCCRHVLPVMVEQGKGSVVNFSSVVALRGNHIAHVYVMAKGGLISFTRALAGAYSPKGIRVNAICPGVVLTERVKAASPLATRFASVVWTTWPSDTRSVSAIRRTSRMSPCSSPLTNRAW
jgi:NAD(P)-dependent dehydrogenase (short-subunit alcohol dehydrogenase family)